MRKKAIKSILLEKVLMQEGRFKGTEEETEMYCEEVEEEKTHSKKEDARREKIRGKKRLRAFFLETILLQKG